MTVNTVNCCTKVAANIQQGQSELFTIQFERRVEFSCRFFIPKLEERKHRRSFN